MNRREFIGGGTAFASLAVLPAFAKTTLPGEGIFPRAVVDALRNRIKPVTKQEREQRMERARKLMAESNIDAVFMEGGTSLNYFTGVRWGRSERLFGMLMTQNGEPFFIAPRFEESRAAEATGSSKIFTWEENESPFELLGKMLREKNVTTGTVGIEETTRFFVTDNFQRSNPAFKIVSATPVTAGCRAVKSALELDLMQVANEMAKEVFLAAMKQLKEGMSESQLATLISKMFGEFGCEGGALVLFGEAAAHPHGLVKEAVLKEGDVVLMDGGCSVEGYQSDITRTGIFGKPSQKVKDVFAIVRKAQDAGLKAARPGVPAESVDAAARKIISDAGYGPSYKYFTHRLGHGIGMDGHEWYYLVGGNKRLLEAGNMFSNEPGIYIPGEFGIRVEDEMLITESGAKLLLPQQESLEKLF